MLARGARSLASSSVRDGAVVSAVQGAGAVLRFVFQIALARAFAPAAVADVAVALSWSQVIAAASGGGGGTFLLRRLPGLIGCEQGRAVPLYRGTVRSATVAAGLAAAAVALVLSLTGASGGTLGGVAVLCTAPIRAALLTTQEALRSVGALALSQVLTLVVQPATSVAVLGGASVLASGGADPGLAACALVVGLAVAFVPARRGLMRRIGRARSTGPVECPSLKPLLRYGAVSALLVWMFEGPLVLSALAISDKADLALLNAHVRLSMATALASVVVSTVASSQWSRRVRQGHELPSMASALRWSGMGAGAATMVASLLFVVGRPVLNGFGDTYDFSAVVLAGLVVKDVALAAAAPIFYFLVMHGREASAARSAVAGGAGLLAVVPLAAVGGLRGVAVGTAGAGLVWFGSFLFGIGRGQDA